MTKKSLALDAPDAPDDAIKAKAKAAKSAMLPAVDAEATGAPKLKVQLKKKEFFERVVDRSGVKMGDAKTVVEAAMAVLGEALANGEEVNVPPLGKIKVARQKTTQRGIAYNLRMVRNDNELGITAPLAEADQDS